MLCPGSDTLVHEDRGSGLRVHASTEFSADFLAQLERAEFGSKGLRYRRQGLADQLARLSPAVFLELRHENELLGTYALASRRLRAGDDELVGIYRGLLTLAPNAQRRGLGSFFVATAFEWLAARAGSEPTLSWGCIESSNVRSMTLLQSLGASRLGTLESMIAYRQWPRARVGVDEVPDANVIRIALQETYVDCGLRASGETAARYFAVTDASGIVAGARVTPTRVNMLSSGGRWDFLYDRLWRRIPAARRRYDPQNFRYLRFSDVVVRPGRERVWRDLLNTLLARHDTHMAMFVLDTRSRAHELLRQAGLFGHFARSTRQRIHVLAHAWNIPSGRLAAHAARPLAIGPLDI